MDKFDRIFLLHAIFSSRRTAIGMEDLEARLECDRSTVFRTINVLKDRLHAPIVFDPVVGGYRYEESKTAGSYQLPGLWFTATELQALAVLQRLISDIGGGLLEEHLDPISSRIEELIKHQKLHLSEAAERLRFPALGARPAGAAFPTVAAATLQRRKIWMIYRDRSRDTVSERTVSPQRLTHYREGWYLDAWDHEREGLRTFAVDRISRPVLLDEPARDISVAELDEHYASSYGIFGGKADKEAVLRFSAERARWVADEQWHPQQQGAYLPDGRFELRFPYRDSRELVMDILRHGGEVEVITPDSLREEVLEAHRRALAVHNQE